MTVRRNFEALYQANPDPWGIGDATAERYAVYFDLLKHYSDGGEVLEMGCGTGAFLNKISPLFDLCFGFDISPTAIKQARKKYPKINFAVGKVTNPPWDNKFDCIILSDVIYYVWRKRKVMKWISTHLRREGTVLIAAYSPGGRWMTRKAITKLVRRYLNVLEPKEFPDKVMAFICREKE